MSERQKVLVAMSGGVDSSVAAARLVQAGYDATGVFICLGRSGAGDSSTGCCSPQDAADARRVAEKLGIGLYVLNLADVFEPIIDYFVQEYAAGRTPNPCVHCNMRVKFGRLLDYADSLGIRYVATGHHARILQGPQGPAIAMSANRRKDQSYVLFALERERLGRILLPLGDIENKDDIRRLAQEMGLSVFDKPDSQEICFVPDDDHVAFLAGRIPDAFACGEIVNSRGEVLGRHKGYAGFTIGQRRGLGVAAGVPMYVTHIDPATARVTIGPKEEVLRSHLTAGQANWHMDMPEEFDALVKIRYNHEGAPGHVRITGPRTFEVDFTHPIAAVTPGQAAVIYQGERLLGGGWID